LKAAQVTGPESLPRGVAGSRRPVKSIPAAAQAPPHTLCSRAARGAARTHARRQHL